MKILLLDSQNNEVDVTPYVSEDTMVELQSLESLTGLLIFDSIEVTLLNCENIAIRGTKAFSSAMIWNNDFIFSTIKIMQNNNSVFVGEIDANSYVFSDYDADTDTFNTVKITAYNKSSKILRDGAVSKLVSKTFFNDDLLTFNENFEGCLLEFINYDWNNQEKSNIFYIDSYNPVSNTAKFQDVLVFRFRSNTIKTYNKLGDIYKWFLLKLYNYVFYYKQTPFIIATHIYTTERGLIANGLQGINYLGEINESHIYEAFFPILRLDLEQAVKDEWDNNITNYYPNFIDDVLFSPLLYMQNSSLDYYDNLFLFYSFNNNAYTAYPISNIPINKNFNIVNLINSRFNDLIQITAETVNYKADRAVLGNFLKAPLSTLIRTLTTLFDVKIIQTGEKLTILKNIDTSTQTLYFSDITKIEYQTTTNERLFQTPTIELQTSRSIVKILKLLAKTTSITLPKNEETYLRIEYFNGTNFTLIPVTWKLLNPPEKIEKNTTYYIYVTPCGENAIYYVPPLGINYRYTIGKYQQQKWIPLATLIYHPTDIGKRDICETVTTNTPGLPSWVLNVLYHLDSSIFLHNYKIEGTEEKEITMLAIQPDTYRDNQIYDINTYYPENYNINQIDLKLLLNKKIKTTTKRIHFKTYKHIPPFTYIQLVGDVSVISKSVINIEPIHIIYNIKEGTTEIDGIITS